MQSSDWFTRLPLKDQEEAMREITALTISCAQSGDFTPISECLKKWQTTSAYYQAANDMSEEEAMDLALEAQSFARQQNEST